MWPGTKLCMITKRKKGEERKKNDVRVVLVGRVVQVGVGRMGSHAAGG